MLNTIFYLRVKHLILNTKKCFEYVSTAVRPQIEQIFEKLIR